MKKREPNALPPSIGIPNSQIHFRLLKALAFKSWLGICLLSSQTGQAQPTETLWKEGVRLEKRNEDGPAFFKKFRVCIFTFSLS